MKKESWIIALFIIAINMWFFPQWNGFFLPSLQITNGEGKIIAIICLTGALILWYFKKGKTETK